MRITSFHHYYAPIRHLLIFDSFPVLTVIESTLLQGISPWDEEDFSSCLVCPYDHAATTTPPKSSIVSVRFRLNLLPSLYGREFGLRGFSLSGPPLCSLSLRPDHSLLPYGKFVGRLQHLGFPPCCYPSYRGLTFPLVGFYCSLLNIPAFPGRTTVLVVSPHTALQESIHSKFVIRLILFSSYGLTSVCSSNSSNPIGHFLAGRFPMYVAFPRSEYYQPVRLPYSHLASPRLLQLVPPYPCGRNRDLPSLRKLHLKTYHGLRPR